MRFLSQVREFFCKVRANIIRKQLFHRAFPNYGEMSGRDQALLHHHLLSGKPIAGDPNRVQYGNSGGRDIPGKHKNLQEAIELATADYRNLKGQEPTFIELPEFFSRPGWKYEDANLQTRYSAFLSVGQFALGS